LDLAVGERDEIVALKKVENTLPEEIHDDANVSAVIEAISKMDATIAVVDVVQFERLQNSQLNLAGLAVLLHGADNLDGHQLVTSFVSSLHHFAKGALAKEFYHLI